MQSRDELGTKTEVLNPANPADGEAVIESEGESSSSQEDQGEFHDPANDQIDDQGNPPIVIMADLTDQIPALEETSTLEEALSALAAGVKVLGNEQAIDNDTKKAVRDVAKVAATIAVNKRAAANRANQVRPMTTLPTYDANVVRVETIEDIKTPGLEVFKGSHNKQVCLSWLARIMATAKQHKLTDKATILLMKAKCSEEAFDSIEQDERQGNGLETIVVSLERKFAGVCLPDEARTICNTMRRNGDEMLSVFGDRLNKMARIATRNILDDDERKRQEEDLTLSNLKRVLPVQTKHDLEERIATRSAQGLSPLSYTDYMAVVDALEQRRLGRLSQVKDDLRRRKVRNKYGIRFTAEDQVDEPMLNNTSQQFDDADEDSDSFELELTDDYATYFVDDKGLSEEDDDDDDTDHEDEIDIIFNAVRYANKPNVKGKTREKFVRKAIKKVFKARDNKYPPYVPQGPPKLLSQCKINLADLPRIAKVDRDECLHCGIATKPPHKSRDHRCPLRGLPMVDRACMKCGKGLHTSNQCPVLNKGPKGPKN